MCSVHKSVNPAGSCDALWEWLQSVHTFAGINLSPGPSGLNCVAASQWMSCSAAG